MEIYKNKYAQLSFLETSSSKNQTVLSLRALAMWSACFLCPHLLPGLSSCYEVDVKCVATPSVVALVWTLPLHPGSDVAGFRGSLMQDTYQVEKPTKQTQ